MAKAKVKIDKTTETEVESAEEVDALAGAVPAKVKVDKTDKQRIAELEAQLTALLEAQGEDSKAARRTKRNQPVPLPADDALAHQRPVRRARGWAAEYGQLTPIASAGKA